MSKSLYSVLRRAEGDCTGNGLSSKVTNGWMFYNCTREEAIQYCKDNQINPDKCFFLAKRMLWGKDHSYAEPLVKQQGNQMFGGNFLYTSNDGSFKFEGENFACPIPVHDRFETQYENDGLSI